MTDPQTPAAPPPTGGSPSADPAPTRAEDTRPAGPRCGFVAVIGAPNAGKSTLVNQLVGAKVSIVTHKAQTTRTRIRGVAMVLPPDARTDEHSDEHPDGRTDGHTDEHPDGHTDKGPPPTEAPMAGESADAMTPREATPAASSPGLPAHAAQVVFIDTPGIFRPRRRFDRAMVAAAWDGALEADRTLVVVDARRGLTDEVDDILTRLGQERRPVLLALNKVDALKDRRALLDLAARFDTRMTFERIFMISALTGSGCRDLLTHLGDTAPPGPWMFPEDELSDLPQRLLAAEITREQVFLQLHEELPYAAAVVTDSWQDRPDGGVRLDQTILVERDSQRAIVLGRGGARIKAIGSAARRELAGLLDRPVHLFLHVKVDERLWDSRSHYADWGLNYDA